MAASILYPPASGPWEPAAEVWARCGHLDQHVQQLAAWAIGSDGQIWIHNHDYWRTEYVGYQPTDEERLAAQESGLPSSAWAAGPPGDDQPAHWREVVTCPRSGCPYDHHLGLRGRGLVDQLLRGMLEQGKSHAVLDLDELTREPSLIFRRVLGPD